MLYEARTLKSLFTRDIVMWEKSEMSSCLQFPWGGGGGVRHKLSLQ